MNAPGPGVPSPFPPLPPVLRSLSPRYRYPRDSGIHETRTMHNGRNKNYTLISVSHDPLRLGRDDDFPYADGSPPFHRARRGFHYAPGLPDVTGVTEE
jgi:hypothetical protein